jgi:hypothetical protein
MTQSVRVLSALLLVLGTSSALRAQSSSEPGAGAPQGPGQLIVADPQTGEKVRLAIARYRARVVLQPPQALVQIEQSFENPYGEQDEGAFAINLPVGASVCRFATQAADGPLREAELADHQPLWGGASAGGAGPKEASILKEVGTYLFRIRLPDVAGQGAHRIWFDYTVPLVAEHGAYQFRLPLRSDLPPVAEFEVGGTITPPVEVESVHVEWQGPSPGVPTTVQLPRRADGGIDFEWRAVNTPLPEALTVEYREPAGRAARLRTYTVREKDGVGTAWQHFVVTIPADEAEAGQVDTEPIDVQIVADTSGSMRDFDALQQTVRRIVMGLRPEDRFQLGCVDAEYRAVTQDWTAARSAAAEEALKSLDHDLPLGTSNLWHALSTAASALERGAGDRRQAIIYVGDGTSTDGPGDGDWRKVRLPRQVAVSAVQLAEDEHGSEFLRNVVEAGSGRLFRVRSDPRELQDTLAWLRRGMPQPKPIEDLRISAGDDLEWFTPESWPAGQDLAICGRCRPTHSIRVSLTLRGAAQPRVYALDVPADEAMDFFVGRLWAQRQLAELLSRGPDEDQERTEIARLGQEWSLVTPYSAFLVPGDGLEFSRWVAGRGYRRRYWEAPGSESVAVGGEPRQVRIDRRPYVAPPREALAALAERDFLETLGGRRGLLDRSAVAELPVADPLLRSLALGGMSPEYLEHHPYAPQLLRRLTLAGQTMSLADFVKLLG